MTPEHPAITAEATNATSARQPTRCSLVAIHAVDVRAFGARVSERSVGSNILIVDGLERAPRQIIRCRSKITMRAAEGVASSDQQAHTGFATSCGASPYSAPCIEDSDTRSFPCHALFPGAVVGEAPPTVSTHFGRRIFRCPRPALRGVMKSPRGRRTGYPATQ
jgi:hypothetical protein